MLSNIVEGQPDFDQKGDGVTILTRCRNPLKRIASPMDLLVAIALLLES
jgi:hypothetical protein